MENTNLTIAFWAFVIIANIRFSVGKSMDGWYAIACAFMIFIIQIIKR